MSKLSPPLHSKIRVKRYKPTVTKRIEEKATDSKKNSGKLKIHEEVVSDKTKTEQVTSQK